MARNRLCVERRTYMSTTIRPELSEKNQYWIERHRYYELKHFCMQYPLWKQLYNTLANYSESIIKEVPTGKTNNIFDPVTKCLNERLYYAERMKLVERVAKETDEELSCYILKAVTEGISYDHMKAKFNIPCCKDIYYDLYRQFFWLLDIERG